MIDSWPSGSLLYLVGTVLVTMVFNVPRNDALAALAAATLLTVALYLGRGAGSSQV